jgi:hypothetical protein
MSKPLLHAQSSAKKFGGEWQDYMEIHELMDSSKQVIADNRHRCLTHNSWFIGNILPKIFGEVFFRKSDGKPISVRDIGEQHVLEDFKNRFIPTAQDYIQLMEYKDWMQNGIKGSPSSFNMIKIKNKNKNKKIKLDGD